MNQKSKEKQTCSWKEDMRIFNNNAGFSITITLCWIGEETWRDFLAIHYSMILTNTTECTSARQFYLKHPKSCISILTFVYIETWENDMLQY